MARQGHAFAQADEARVAKFNESTGRWTDVADDGNTVGEIIVRGNIVMKEVRPISVNWFRFLFPVCSTFLTQWLRERLSEEDILHREILRLDILMGAFPSRIGPRT